jgi:hypothetical protein
VHVRPAFCARARFDIANGLILLQKHRLNPLMLLAEFL